MTETEAQYEAGIADIPPDEVVVYEFVDRATGQVINSSSQKPEPPPIHVALSNAMREITAVGKADRNTTQGYDFRGIDAVVNAVGPAFRNAGIVCIPTVLDYQEERFQTTKGAALKGVSVKVRYTLYGPAGDSLSGETYGEAADSGDKATPKAFSVAYRIFLLQALCIPTSDRDPDADAYERQAGPPSTSNQAVYRALLQGVNQSTIVDPELRDAWTNIDAAYKRHSLSEADYVELTRLTNARKAHLEAEGAHQPSTE